MRRRLHALLCGLFALIATASAAGEATLRYEWRDGDVFILNKVVDLAGTIRGGTAPPMAMSERARIRKKLTVERVDLEGRAQLRVALLSISATKSVGEHELQYSLSPERVVMDHTQIWPRSANSRGTSFKMESLERLFRPRTMECSPQGQTGDPSRPVPWLAEASGSDLFHLFGIGEEGWVPLPESPLEPGDTWRDALAQPIRSGTSEFWHDTQLTLNRLEGEGGATLAEIAFQQERRLKSISRELFPNAWSSTPPLKACWGESHQRMTGRVDFNVEEGHPLRCEARGEARLRYSLGGGDLSRELSALVLEYDWDRIRVQSEWERIKRD